MWRDDIFFASPTLEQFFVNKYTNFCKSSDLLNNDERFQGISWSEDPANRGFILAKREAITLKDLRTLLGGRDFEAYQVYSDKILLDGK